MSTKSLIPPDDLLNISCPQDDNSTNIARQFKTHTYLLCELAFGYRYTTKLDVERVGAGYTRRVHQADRSISVVNNVDVDVTSNVAADTTGDITLPSLGGVDGDDALLTHRNSRCNTI